MCILIAVFVPFIWAFILPIVGVLSTKIRNLLALLFVFTSFVMAVLLVPSILNGQGDFGDYQYELGLFRRSRDFVQS